MGLIIIQIEIYFRMGSIIPNKWGIG